MRSGSLCVAVLLCVSILSPLITAAPDQVHIALAESVDKMVVMWTTDDDSASSLVTYWNNDVSQNATVTGTTDSYYFPPFYRSPTIHTATLTGLRPGTTYNYQVGDAKTGYSSVYSFHTERSATTKVQDGQPVVTFVSIADHGTSDDSKNIVSSILQAEQQFSKAGLPPFDFLTHSGDISYANGIQKYWDEWGTLVQPLASHLPWMVSVGNHEILDAFVAYNQRFHMPATASGADDGNLYWSVNYGPVHLVALSSEQLVYGGDLDDQYAWMVKDLANVDRTVTPWIVAMWHSPWYCSNTHHNASGESMRKAYEQAFYSGKVDLVINGHVHAYERSRPVYDNIPMSDAPVYITNGVGGTEEGLVNSWNPSPVWSQYHEGTFWGFGIAQVFNATHLHWELRRVGDISVQDETWIIRQR